MPKFPYSDGVQEKCVVCGRRAPRSRMIKKGGWRHPECYDPPENNKRPKILPGAGTRICKMTRPGTD